MVIQKIPAVLNKVNTLVRFIFVKKKKERYVFY